MKASNSKHGKQPKPVTVTDLYAMKADGHKIVSVTAYDASFAAQVDAAGIDLVLVGDSLGMVVQGHDSTLPVTVADMVYHGAAVRRGIRRAFLVVDMPFLSYASPQAAIQSAGRLMRDGGAQMVKLERAGLVLPVIEALAQQHIPVCAHLGLTPQSIHKIGGYRVQGRSDDGAQQLLADARAVQAAGADLLVVECVPAALASEISHALAIPVIGIGAGLDVDGQVLVLYDVLGITAGHKPRFSRDFLAGQNGGVTGALEDYAQAVRSGQFPAPEHIIA